MSKRPDYGIDAPGVLRNLFLGGIACVLAGIFVPQIFSVGHVSFKLKSGFYTTGTILLVETALYLLYVKWGKFRHRDTMLAQHAWSGDESVLDVGCGRGLLVIGAAKHLTTGTSIGIDIWSNKDMGGNAMDRTMKNARLEGVENRVTLLTEDVRKLSFADATFDVVVSNLCLHNISSREGRHAAIEDIVRVLKPGGQAILSDYRHTGEYAKAMRAAGMYIVKRRINPVTTFPPLTYIVATKPQ
ncbi:MAG: class I SAM-dependent methyltransferase [Acidobacteria bacterium]|nr:class I SAM-dependent methyltransferase [Acidobacteriota bacterium]